MAGTDRLKIYNGALELVGGRELASLTESRKSRRLLDRVWNANGVRFCLEQGEWQFAMRTQQIDPDPDADPQFGYAYPFNKPDDWIATHAVCSDAFFRAPLTRYADEVGYWYADINPIFVKFTSDDVLFGGDLSKWPQSFCDYVYAYFASKVVRSLTGDERRVIHICGDPSKIDSGVVGKALKIAKSRAGMTQPTRFPAPGSWNKARHGRGTGNSRPDGGNPSSLIG